MSILSTRLSYHTILLCSWNTASLRSWNERTPSGCVVGGPSTTIEITEIHKLHQYSSGRPPVRSMGSLPTNRSQSSAPLSNTEIFIFIKIKKHLPCQRRGKTRLVVAAKPRHQCGGISVGFRRVYMIQRANKRYHGGLLLKTQRTHASRLSSTARAQTNIQANPGWTPMSKKVFM